MAFHPICISPWGHEISPDRFGNKIASLARLMSIGMTVPPTWGIPTQYTFLKNRCDICFCELPVSMKYAVRSGSKYSMPGIQATILNVPQHDLMGAVRKVWDSYFTDHAKAYRQNKGYPEDMGTAVAIQTLVNAKISGVAFTCDPAHPEQDFNPLIEYVEGFGDKLVGGTAAAIPLTNGYVYDVLCKGLEKIHNAYGPSDVEWVWDGGVLWYVQQRTLKFAPAILTECGAKGDLITTGRSIGGQGNATGQLCFNGSKTTGKVLYVDEFKPEYYKAMMDAAAIITATGGATCHASIIAREMNKPAISYITKDSLPEEGTPITLCGKFGTVHKATKEEVTKASNAPKVKTTSSKLDKSRNPNFTIMNTKWDMNSLLTRFYWIVQSKLEQTKKDKAIKEIADIISLYLFLACCGEARHAGSRSHATTKAKNAVAALEKYGMPVSKDYNIAERENFVVLCVRQPKDIKEAVDITRHLRVLFDKGKWAGSFGGPLWGKIAHLLLLYLSNKQSPLTFVDSAFNLKHNGGMAFAKFEWLRVSNDLMQTQLNTKQTGSIERLLGITKDYLPSIDSFVAKESLLETA